MYWYFRFYVKKTEFEQLGGMRNSTHYRWNVTIVYTLVEYAVTLFLKFGKVPLHMLYNRSVHQPTQSADSKLVLNHHLIPRGSRR
jgi:hypothetical protein